MLTKMFLQLNRRFFIILIVLICLTTQVNYGQNPQNETFSLELNKPIERDIKGEEKHSYQITIAANQYVLVTIEQRNVDVTVGLSATDGESNTNFDTESRPNNQERLEFVVKSAGNYQLDIEKVYTLLPDGKYEIRLAETRPANEADQTLFEAHLLYAEVVRLFNFGKYAEAQKVIEQVIEKRLKTVGLENLLTVEALTQQAIITSSQGIDEEAIKLHQRALNIKEKILVADHPAIARSLSSLSFEYFAAGNIQTSLLLSQQALASIEKAMGRMHPRVASYIKKLGIIHGEYGDKLKALELYQQALAIFEQTYSKESVVMADILNQLSEANLELHKYEKAESFALRSIAILEKRNAPNKKLIFPAHVNLARIYYKQGKLDEAESIYLQFLKTHETIGATSVVNAATLQALAEIYTLKSDLERAEVFYRRALDIFENSLGPDNYYVGPALSGLSFLLAQKGDVEEAIKLQQRAAIIDEKIVSLNLATGSERQKLAFIYSFDETPNRIKNTLFFNTRFAPDNQTATELAATTLLQEKGRVVDAVSNNLIQLRQRFNTRDQILLDKLNEFTRQLAGLILRGPKNTTIVEHQIKIKSLTDEREQLEDEISRYAAGFYTKSQAVTLPAIQNLIPLNSTLLEFAVYTPAESSLIPKIRKSAEKPRYIVYIISQNGKTKWKDIGEVGEIDQMINEFRQSLRNPRSNTKKIARAVDERVMQPVRALMSNTKQLLISPDGELNLIPFEALVDEKGKYLVENYSFAYLTSGRDLLRMQKAAASKNNSLIIANPAFSKSTGSEISQIKKTEINDKRRSVTATKNLSDTYFAPLAGTMLEARSIHNLFPDWTLLTGAEATESSIKQTNAPQILHIATHGFFLQDAESVSDSQTNAEKSEVNNPLLQSGLALAGANMQNNAKDNSKDDGILTALEASGLNLWGTKLVVLSACDTGLGDVQNGEGIYGLRRAFVLAGAESQVMSLWSISDNVTREIMTNYYKNLKQGKGRGESLRQVQLEMLKRSGRQHPFYWAAFIQSGEWGNLDGKR